MTFAPVPVIATEPFSSLPAQFRRVGKHSAWADWAAEPAERGPPSEASDWPRNAVIPITYHLSPGPRDRVAK